MPTQSTTYNSRVTDEALEKRFRDTFRSQGGAELVDDLYAQGVIVPVVDFTAAATGQQLAQNLQTAWDFSTGLTEVDTGTVTIISNSGFWLVNAFIALDADANADASLLINDGATTKRIFRAYIFLGATNVGEPDRFEGVVYLRAGDELQGTVSSGNTRMSVAYRQIATVNGDLVNPTGFTSS